MMEPPCSSTWCTWWLHAPAATFRMRQLFKSRGDSALDPARRRLAALTLSLHKWKVSAEDCAGAT